MVKIVDMTSALQQVREKAPDTADAMKRFKSGNAGFTDKAHLKAKGMIPRADGTKKVSDKYKEDLDKKDVATIKPIIKQLQKSVKSHDKQAKQLTKDISDEKGLEEQAKELEEQLKTAEKELEELYIKEDKAYVIRFQRIALYIFKCFCHFDFLSTTLYGIFSNLFEKTLPPCFLMLSAYISASF